MPEPSAPNADDLAADGADIPEGIEPPTLDERAGATQFFKDLDDHRS